MEMNEVGLDNGLNTFEKNILKTKYHTESKYDFVIKNNLKFAWIIATIVIVINSFWLIVRERFESFAIPKEPIVYFSLLFQIVLSVVLLIMSLCYKKITNIAVVRHLFLFYYLYLIYAVTIIVISEYNLAYENGVPDRYIGLSLITFYLFIIVALPMPKISYGMVIISALILSLVVQFIVIKDAPYSLIVHTVLKICLIAGYFAFRKYNINLALKNYEIVKLNNQLLVYSYVDFLTNVMNRRALDTYWEWLCDNDDVENVGIILFDIDYFKSYNDTYSHRNGDNILRKISAITMDMLDSEKNLLFRYGGEEFIIVFVNTTKKELLDFAFELKKRVYEEKIYRADVSEFDRITITCGCGIIKKEDMDKSDYITNSDKQLYVGKRNNRNCVVFDEEIF